MRKKNEKILNKNRDLIYFDDNNNNKRRSVGVKKCKLIW